MAIIKKELNAEEIKKLSEEELKQVDGGLITIKDIVGIIDDTITIETVFTICDNNGNFVGVSDNLDKAIEVCEAFGYSTEIIDGRQYR